MSLAIDAIILFAAVFIIWAGTSRGFVRSIMSLCTTVASLFAAYAYTPLLAKILEEKFLAGKITSGIEETLRSLAFDTSTDLYNLDRLAEDLPEPFTGILERYNVNIASFIEKLRGITGCGENTVHHFAEEIASPTSSVLANVLAFLAIFIGAFLALSILTGLLDLIFKLPVLNAANMFFGFLFGAAEALVVAFALAILLSTLVAALGALDPSLFGQDVVDHTLICSYLLSHNPLERFAGILS